MSFRKGAVALCVSSALFSMGVAAQNDGEAKSSFGEVANQTGVYTLYLNQAAALAGGSDNKHDYRNEVASIKNAQDRLFAEIKAKFPSAKLIGSGQRLANFITIELAKSDAMSLTQLDQVRAVSVNAREARSEVSARANLTKQASTEAVNVANTDLSVMPSYTDEQAGAGASVAIISSGIDYTLAFFGGSGVYGDVSDPETPPEKGSYMDAMVNNTIEFEGFPTEVVAGGFDLASENWGVDPNPIEPNLVGADWAGNEYDTGIGTELASIVHQLAPAAKLYAYKVSNIMENEWNPGTFNISWPTQAKIIQALEYAIDPNQDGDTSDHVDVALLDSNGMGAFVDMNAAAGPDLIQFMIETASSHGMTVVTSAGSWGEYFYYGEAEVKHRHGLSSAAGTTSTIAVGSVLTDEDGETLTMAPYSPKGTVRGSMALKPELVTLADDQTVAKISAETDHAVLGERGGAVVAAARIAAATATVKGKYPGLGPVELKAILANTANREGILESDGSMAEIISKGHGIENVEAALATPIVAWDKANAQPYLQFGAHEVAMDRSFVKYVTIRNLSDSAQSYQLNFNADGDKPGMAAITPVLPESVSVPANASVQVAIELQIEAGKLPAWNLHQTSDYTEENLSNSELSGYITLTSEGNPDVNLGWMIKARPATVITKDPSTAEMPEYLGWNSELGKTEWNALPWAAELFPDDDWGNPQYQGWSASFVNDSTTETTFEAYPLIVHKPHLPVGKEKVAGHMIRAVGIGMYDEPMCDSGKKISVAVNFHRPADIADANYYDKIGSALFYYDLFYEQIVLDNEMDKSFGGAPWLDDADTVNQPWVAINAKGQPVTYFIDKNKEYDPMNHFSRYTPSKLETKFTNNGKNVVSNVCADELYHHDLDSIDDFDQNMGFHIETDRDAGIEKFDPLPMINLTRNGYYKSEEVCQPLFWDPTQEVCETVTVNTSVHVSLDVLAEGETVSDVASPSHSKTVQPGEAVTITSVASGGFNSTPMDFMVLSTNDDFMQIGTNSAIDSDGSVIQDVKQGQSFTVSENAEIGTVVGQLLLDTAAFFAVGNIGDDDFELQIMNPVPGTPFRIEQATGELVVANPAALDYESVQSIELNIIARQGNSIGIPAIVTVNVSNVNDMAPEANSEKLAVLNQSMVYKAADAAAISIDLSGLFSDVDMDGLTYSVASESLTDASVDGMMLTATSTELGEKTFTVTATDGIQSTSVDVTVNVMEMNEAPNAAEPTNLTVQIGDDDRASVSVQLSDLFSDVNGDTLTFEVMGSGLSVQGDSLVGNFTQPGKYTVVVAASDSEFTEYATVNVDVLEKEKSDGGSLGWMALALSGLLFRRVKR